MTSTTEVTTRYQFFVATVASPSEPKTTVFQVQRIRATTDDDIWYSFPDSATSTSQHAELMKTPSMSLAHKALKLRGQSRTVAVGLSKSLESLYVNQDGNFVFKEFLLAETKFRTTSELPSEMQDLVRSISSIATREESVKTILKHFLIEKFSSKNRCVESWCLNFEKESERLDVHGAKRIEVFKSCLEPELSDWFIVSQNKLGVSADWSLWKANLISTFGDSSWTPICYAFNFKYLAGSYTDYTIKKEKLLLELNRDLSSLTILDLVIVGLPDQVTKTLNKNNVKTIDDLRQKIKKFDVEDKLYEKGTHQNFNNKFSNKSSTNFGSTFNKRDERFKKSQSKNFYAKSSFASRVRPCSICAGNGSPNRFHPEARCWFKDEAIKKESNIISLRSPSTSSEDLSKN